MIATVLLVIAFVCAFLELLRDDRRGFLLAVAVLALATYLLIT